MKGKADDGTGQLSQTDTVAGTDPQERRGSLALLVLLCPLLSQRLEFHRRRIVQDVPLCLVGLNVE